MSAIGKFIPKSGAECRVYGYGGNDTITDSNGSDTAFECGDALGEDVLRRVREAAVDIAGILQCEAVSSMLRVVEHEGRRLVDWHSARIRSGISLFLANVQLQRLKMVLSLFTHE